MLITGWINLINPEKIKSERVENLKPISDLFLDWISDCYFS
jgi:hypothetical protein